MALISLIRAINPAMLRQEPDGFAVDFELLEAKAAPDADEQLLLKFRAALESPEATGSHALELADAECERLAGTLARLESLRQWAPDVLAMSRHLRARLATVK